MLMDLFVKASPQEFQVRLGLDGCVLPPLVSSPCGIEARCLRNVMGVLYMEYITALQSYIIGQLCSLPVIMDSLQMSNGGGCVL